MCLNIIQNPKIKAHYKNLDKFKELRQIDKEFRHNLDKIQTK